MSSTESARLDLLRSGPARDHFRPVEGELKLLGRFHCPGMLLKRWLWTPCDVYVEDRREWDPDLLLNDQYFVAERYGTGGNKLFLVHEHATGLEHPVLHVVAWRDFYLAWCHRPAPDASGPLSRWWKAHPGRRSYGTIRFFPVSCSYD